MDLDQCVRVIDNFLEFCEEFRVDPLIALTGGDPILLPWFWDLVENLYRRNIPFVVLGNPFHLDQSVCDKLSRCGCVAYQMSLDGLEQTHDSIRQEGSFRNTLSAVKLLQGSGIKTMIMSTISKRNYREIPQLARLVVEQKIGVYDFARYCPTPNNTQLLLSPTEYQHFLSTVWDLFSEFKGGITKFPLKDHLWRLFLYEKGLFKIRKEKVIVRGCGCGIRHLTMLPNGIVYACRRFESPVGDILKESFGNIFLSERLGKYREVELLEGCKDCSLLNYCRGCHAVSFGVSGNFFTKDPNCWRVIQPNMA